MKFDRQSWFFAKTMVKRPLGKLGFAKIALIWLLLAVLNWPNQSAHGDEMHRDQADANATLLVSRTMEQLVLGDAFDAKLRQRIWVASREVVGVGHYEQSGGGSGRFNLEMTIHDGDTRQSMRQISDGKLCWTRTQVGEWIAISRIDIGRIDEFQRDRLATFARLGQAESLSALPARLRVGGIVELLDKISRDYDLRVGKGTVERQPVWTLRGQLTAAAVVRLKAISGRDDLAPLCPAEVRVAIAATGDATGFGVGLPIRIEFWSSPDSAVPIAPKITPVSKNLKDNLDPSDSVEGSPHGAPAGRLISLLELYATRRIEPSPEERFRFTSDDREVTFTNDTSKYLDDIGRP